MRRKRPGLPGYPFLIPEIKDSVWLSFVTSLSGDRKQDAAAIEAFAAFMGVCPNVIAHKVALEEQEAFSEMIELIDPHSETVH